MDKILEGYVNNFLAEKGITDVKGTESFELFVNYTILSKTHADPFDVEIASVGGGNDTSIDGLAILVNDHIVSTKEEIGWST